MAAAAATAAAAAAVASASAYVFCYASEPGRHLYGSQVRYNSACLTATSDAQHNHQARQLHPQMHYQEAKTHIPS